MCKGNYSICSIFSFQKRISRPELFGCTHFQQPPESNVCPQKCLSGGCGIVLLSIRTCVKGITVLYLLNLSIPKENFEARAVRLYSFSATPGKQCLPPKVSLEGLRDRPAEYTTCVKGITVFAQSVHSKREFRGQRCSAVLIFSNPRKAMFAPKSVSRGVAGSSC